MGRVTESRPDHSALPGDSGALVHNDHGPVGLVIAVNEDLGGTYVCKASYIEKLLGVRFVPRTSVGSNRPRFEPATFPSSPRDRFDVLIGGISIGHGSVTAGTLGAFVWDTTTQELLCLTCAHVAAPLGAAVGDPIYQPGPLDIHKRLGRQPNDSDIAGYLTRWIPISFRQPNLIDAALFRPIRPVWPSYVFKYGERLLTRPVS
jgi:hypothetical protein